MATIRKKWTGRESHALREAMRLSQRDFANELDISAKSISNWESGGAEFVQRPESQAILDTKLRQVSYYSRTS
jgi:DNA-binding transcriptional regulator YiaG